MSILSDILYKVPIESVVGSTRVSIINIHIDSRRVSLNDVFIAIKGVQTDGHLYISKAVEQGALVIVCEELPSDIVNGVTYVKVKDTMEASSIIASNFYNNPTDKLKLVGVTGTNGKTTVATLLWKLFKEAGYKVGLISTVKNCIQDRVIQATHTTPDVITLQKLLSTMVEEGVTHCFMEVSSHGIDQKRIDSSQFTGGIFTNLSHDHLDYHKTFAAYRDVKKSFFDRLPKTAFAWTNIDDKNGELMLQNTKAEKKTYALKTLADVKASIIESSFRGMQLQLNNYEVWTPLIGSFNASNLLAVFGASQSLGMETLTALKLLSKLTSVDGRFQYVVSDDNITAIVDYAHTPDALKNVLTTINNVRTHNQKVITVVGCGGDRDNTKRPIMGGIATEFSDHVVFTSDNPRTEDPNQILKEIEEGVQPQHSAKYVTIENRREAIQKAVSLAAPNDIILIAGKGHETYQDINGKKQHFNDLEEVNQSLKS